MAKRVLIQAGHVAPREPGFESGTGTVREQELTSAMQKRLVNLLKADGRFVPIPQPGDLSDVDCDAALFLHGDGSSSKEATGRSFGFPDHSINRALAQLLEKHLSRIPGAPPKHEWNYTGGLRFYYGYSRISTAGPEVLIEHGFLTNPAEQKWIFAHLNEQAEAEYKALCEFFKLAPRARLVGKRLGYVVVWIDDKGVTHRKRTAQPRRLFHRLWSDGIRQRILIRKRKPIQSAQG